MSKFLEIVSRKLRESGCLVLFFNARTEASWRFLNSFSASANTAGMVYCGSFPLVYSAASVVQDNREGALRTDYGLVFSRSAVVGRSLADIPGWIFNLPTGACRTHGLPIPTDLADAALLQDLWAKVSDHPSPDCKQLIAELVDFRNALVTEIERDPVELIRWALREPGRQTF